MMVSLARWHESDDVRVSSPLLQEPRDAIPRGDARLNDLTERNLVRQLEITQSSQAR